MSLINAAAATMSFVAHIDDDFLFQNPDIQDSIDAGGGHTTVYLTAGDAGLGPDHWQAREAGAKSAYSEMTGQTDWVDSVATFGTAENTFDVHTSYLASQPDIRLYFLRLPDGSPNGTGYDVTGQESLERLWNFEIENVASVDGENNLSADDLSGLLLGIMNFHQPDEILIQDQMSDFADRNHSDHVNGAEFVMEARQYYTNDHEVHSYLEYSTRNLDTNLAPEIQQQNLDTYHAYLRGYLGEDDPDVIPPHASTYLNWSLRQYQNEDFQAPDVSPSELQDFPTYDFLSETNDPDLVLIAGPGGGPVVPCFTPGTMIATAKGERRVEDLAVGDRVITRDNGMQVIRWIGRCALPGAELAAKHHLRPVLIRQGALGNGLPERDMMVSPQHRVLIANHKTSVYFDAHEVLVAAKHLTDMDGIDIVEVSQTTYIHVMFDRHEMILSDGIWTESFQPGDLSLAGIGDASRREIAELFPELSIEGLVAAYVASRRSLKGYEARTILD